MAPSKPTQRNPDTDEEILAGSVSGVPSGKAPQDALPAPVPQGGARRMNVAFSENAYQTLTELAQTTGKSMADVLRDAIALEKWVQDEHRKGGRVLIEREGEIRELIVR